MRTANTLVRGGGGGGGGGVVTQTYANPHRAHRPFGWICHAVAQM